MVNFGQSNEGLSFLPTLVPDNSCQATHPPPSYINTIFLLTLVELQHSILGCLLCTDSFHLMLSLTFPAGKSIFIFSLPDQPTMGCFLMQTPTLLHLGSNLPHTRLLLLKVILLTVRSAPYYMPNSHQPTQTSSSNKLLWLFLIWTTPSHPSSSQPDASLAEYYILGKVLQGEMRKIRGKLSMHFCAWKLSFLNCVLDKR